MECRTGVVKYNVGRNGYMVLGVVQEGYGVHGGYLV